MSERTATAGQSSQKESEELKDVVGGRTLWILEPRRARKTHRRGWLVRRVLLIADVVGLVVAFFFAELVFMSRAPGTLNVRVEALLFVATLPLWVLIARLYGLYSFDDQLTNHVTTDEVAQVFHMVTVCTWLFFGFTWLTGVAHPDVEKLLLFLGICGRARTACSYCGADARSHESELRPERGHRRCR